MSKKRVSSKIDTEEKMARKLHHRKVNSINYLQKTTDLIINPRRFMRVVREIVQNELNPSLLETLTELVPIKKDLFGHEKMIQYDGIDERIRTEFEKTHEFKNWRNLQFNRSALTALQEAAENYICSFFKDANYCAHHARRNVVDTRDFEILKRFDSLFPSKQNTRKTAEQNAQRENRYKQRQKHLGRLRRNAGKEENDDISIEPAYVMIPRKNKRIETVREKNENSTESSEITEPIGFKQMLQRRRKKDENDDIVQRRNNTSNEPKRVTIEDDDEVSDEPYVIPRTKSIKTGLKHMLQKRRKEEEENNLVERNEITLDDETDTDENIKKNNLSPSSIIPIPSNNFETSSEITETTTINETQNTSDFYKTLHNVIHGKISDTNKNIYKIIKQFYGKGWTQLKKPNNETEWEKYIASSQKPGNTEWEKYIASSQKPGNDTDWEKYIASSQKAVEDEKILNTMKPLYPISLRNISNLYKQYLRLEKRGNAQFFIVQGVDAKYLPLSTIYTKHAIVQVASQFNFLESINSKYMEIIRYVKDRTQGPMASIGSLAALIERDHYFKKMTDFEIQPIFRWSKNVYEGGYFTPDGKPGYTKISKEEKQVIYNHISINLPTLNIFAQWGKVYKNTILQVFTAAPSYQHRSEKPKIDSLDGKLCEELVTAQYEVIAKIAVMRSMVVNKRVPLHLTLVGQGAFNNPEEVMVKALNKVIEIVRDFNIDVFFHGYSEEDVMKIRRAVGNYVTIPASFFFPSFSKKLKKKA